MRGLLINLLLLVTMIVAIRVAIRWLGKQSEMLLSARTMMNGLVVSCLLGAGTCGVCLTHPFSERPQGPVSTTEQISGFVFGAMLYGLMWGGVLGSSYGVGVARRLLEGPHREATKGNTEGELSSSGRRSDDAKDTRTDRC